MDSKNVEELRNEEDALNESIALNKIVVKLLEERKRELKKTWIFFIAVCVAFTVVFAVSEYQNHREKQELLRQLEDTRIDFMEYLDSIEYETVEETTTTTETTQSVEGDSAVINNGEMQQYNDNAIHQDSAGGD